MLDFPNEIVRGAGDREIPVHGEDLGFLFPEQLHDVSAGVLVAVSDDHSFPCEPTGHFSSPVAWIDTVPLGPLESGSGQRASHSALLAPRGTKGVA
jgi:hypothetical protein